MHKNLVKAAFFCYPVNRTLDTYTELQKMKGQERCDEAAGRENTQGRKGKGGKCTEGGQFSESSVGYSAVQ